jgi:hypothetical protein
VIAGQHHSDIDPLHHFFFSSKSTITHRRAAR